jgi:hypothetical protein
MRSFVAYLLLSQLELVRLGLGGGALGADEVGLERVEGDQGLRQVLGGDFLERHLDVAPSGLMHGGVLEREPVHSRSLAGHGRGKFGEVDAGGQFRSTEGANGIAVDAQRVAA